MKRIFLESKTVKELQLIAKNLGYEQVTRMGNKTPLVNKLCGHTYSQLKAAYKS